MLVRYDIVMNSSTPKKVLELVISYTSLINFSCGCENCFGNCDCNWLNNRCLKKDEKFCHICMERKKSVLRFYNPDNTIKVMSSRSINIINLLTQFLVRLRPPNLLTNI